MNQYLYGASVQGIQGFIFETNKLKEIVGASEIVEKICGTSFDEFLTSHKVNLSSLQFIVKAAGNIRLSSEDKEVIETIIKYWPKYVSQLAPGITLSQATVSFEGPVSKFQMDKLEQALKTQRNKASTPAELSSMAVIRSRRTGKPAVDWKDNKDSTSPRDRASSLKQTAGNGTDNAPKNLMLKCLPEGVETEVKHFPFDVEDIAQQNDSSWLAVIHADGNSLGKIIQGMSDALTDGKGDLQKAYSSFSASLDKATTNATKHAVNQVCLKQGAPKDNQGQKTEKYPFRPVVVGGDDLTVIIRADLALDFTIEFLHAFREESKKELSGLVAEFKLNEFKNGLTACAGIAYMKSSYPFHYAVHLAEELCGDAKKASKEIDSTNVPSSIAFHKIQDSFVEGYDAITKRELRPQENLSFKFGPYGFEGEGLPSFKKLKGYLATILEEEAPKSGVRKWLSLLHKDSNEAALWLQRVIEVTTDDYSTKLDLERLWEKRDTKEKGESKTMAATHLYDVMTLASLMNDKTILKETK